MAAFPKYPFLQLAILRRALEITLRRSREIALLHFNHVPDPHSHDTLIIRYRFENALWYIVDETLTLENRHVVVRPDKEEEKLIMLTVQGLFRKNAYLITICHEKARIMEIRL